HATAVGMTDVPARELRNDVSGVLRRVEAGERLRVTVSGRPVAELVPLARGQQTMSWGEFEQQFEGARADPGLAGELADLLPDSTDDTPLS
ncbi:MAG: type II toxin-antitoxin system Phd/YefM family antitoxin, partial [Jatrophihabitantaceae bacterium]